MTVVWSKDRRDLLEEVGVVAMISRGEVLEQAAATVLAGRCLSKQAS